VQAHDEIAPAQHQRIPLQADRLDRAGQAELSVGVDDRGVLEAIRIVVRVGGGAHSIGRLHHLLGVVFRHLLYVDHDAVDAHLNGGAVVVGGDVDVRGAATRGAADDLHQLATHPDVVFVVAAAHGPVLASVSDVRVDPSERGDLDLDVVRSWTAAALDAVRQGRDEGGVAPSAGDQHGSVGEVGEEVVIGGVDREIAPGRGEHVAAQRDDALVYGLDGESVSGEVLGAVLVWRAGVHRKA